MRYDQIPLYSFLKYVLNAYYVPCTAAVSSLSLLTVCRGDTVNHGGLTSPVMDGIGGHEATEWGPEPKFGS